MMTLTEFLRARFDEDEAFWERERNDLVMGGLAEKALAQVAAHRRIVERHAPVEFFDAPGEYACTVTPNSGFWPCADLLDLASVYADHPDYREEWRP